MINRTEQMHAVGRDVDDGIFASDFINFRDNVWNGAKNIGNMNSSDVIVICRNIINGAEQFVLMLGGSDHPIDTGFSLLRLFYEWYTVLTDVIFHVWENTDSDLVKELVADKEFWNEVLNMKYKLGQLIPLIYDANKTMDELSQSIVKGAKTFLDDKK